jgi:hypothetical protein
VGPWSATIAFERAPCLFSPELDPSAPFHGLHQVFLHAGVAASARPVNIYLHPPPRSPEKVQRFQPSMECQANLLVAVHNLLSHSIPRSFEFCWSIRSAVYFYLAFINRCLVSAIRNREAYLQIRTSSCTRRIQKFVERRELRQDSKTGTDTS